ncbi:MAG: bifunctional oligoribonuclease/PAP phosphatase NrnA [Gemmataceae bacterium]
MPHDWSSFVDFVRRHQRFLITTHVRPDGDALGSMLALADALEAKGKVARRVIASPLPPRYDFIDPNKSIDVFSPPGDCYSDCDAIIVIDTGTWNQLAGMASFVRTSSAEKFVIDHHATQDDLGGQRIVDTSAEAAGRLAYEAVTALGVPLTSTMANCVFLGLAMDTGWFRHPSVSAKTFELAGRLVAAGAQPTSLFDDLYERNSLARLHLTGLALERLRTNADGRIAYTEIRWADYSATGAAPLDTEDLVNYPRSVAGVEVGLLFIEQRDTAIKVSFRARTANVAAVAEQFGGGGHKLAAGATLPGPLDAARSRVLHAVALALGNRLD